MDLALSNLQMLICHKTKSNQTKKIMINYFMNQIILSFKEFWELHDEYAEQQRTEPFSSWKGQEPFSNLSLYIMVWFINVQSWYLIITISWDNRYFVLDISINEYVFTKPHFLEHDVTQGQFVKQNTAGLNSVFPHFHWLLIPMLYNPICSIIYPYQVGEEVMH